MSDKDLKKVSSIDGHKQVAQTDDIQAKTGDTSTVSNVTYVLAAIMTRFAWGLDKSVE